MKVLLGKLNDLGNDNRVYKIDSKVAMEQLVKDAQTRQGGELQFEISNNGIMSGETSEEYNMRVNKINTEFSLGTIENINVEESSTLNASGKPVLMVTGTIIPYDKFKTLVDSDSEFCLRGMTRRDKLVKVITWDLCKKEL